MARELQNRGHSVTFFQIADMEAKIASEGVSFRRIGESDHPPGSLPESLAQLGALQGRAALRFTIRAVQRTTEMICRDGPDAVRAAKLDMVLVDQMEPAGATVAERLGLPFVTVCNALALNREPNIPPPFTPWNYGEAWWAHVRNRVAYQASDWVTRPVTCTLEAYRRQWKLPVYRNPDKYFSPYAQISQQPPAFDFPRRRLPACFHYAGPLRNASPHAIPFPWERLDGRPIVYASLGTLQSGKERIFRCFAEACRNFDVQLVILSYGSALRGMPGSPLIADYVPQIELLQRASLTLTHAGLNTVLDSLSWGVPLVAVPITYEQPAIASRIRWAGVGASVPPKRITAERIRLAIANVLGDKTFRINAGRIQSSILAAGGARRAADIIEQVALSGKPAIQITSQP
ncbi:MAG: glycosyl transferase family 1 [Acidobacteriota bacterium]|nr:glycosyl transferase family 1 [Acidobacteriota bacterium]